MTTEAWAGAQEKGVEQQPPGAVWLGRKTTRWYPLVPPEGLGVAGGVGQVREATVAEP